MAWVCHYFCRPQCPQRKGEWRLGRQECSQEGWVPLAERVAPSLTGIDSRIASGSKAMGYPSWKSVMDRLLSWALWVLAIPVMLIAMALILVADPENWTAG